MSERPQSITLADLGPREPSRPFTSVAINEFKKVCLEKLGAREEPLFFMTRGEDAVFVLSSPSECPWVDISFYTPKYVFGASLPSGKKQVESGWATPLYKFDAEVIKLFTKAVREATPVTKKVFETKAPPYDKIFCPHGIIIDRH